jgi:DNA-directed RNA polymerase specialized sigma24 family protein
MRDRNAALPVPAGRPSKLTPAMVGAAGTMAASGLTITLIAAFLGINRKTAHDWIKEGREAPEDDLRAQFRNALHEGWVNAGKNYLQNLKEQSANGSTTAATWFLTHHPFFREEFSDNAAERRTEKRTLAQVVDAIAASGLTPDDERRVLLQIQARGLGTPAVDEGEG